LVQACRATREKPYALAVYAAAKDAVTVPVAALRPLGTARRIAGAAAATAPARSPSRFAVRVMNDDGSVEERHVTVGVTGGPAVAATLAAFDTPILFSLGPVFLAFGCAFGTGLIFGYMPAHKAATLDPIVALGAE
jgi:ABC-type antimicrobial peptide transport system permease subunit